MDDDLLNLDVGTSYLRRVFGMLTAYVLLPDSNHASAREIDELDLADRVHTLAAGLALWHLMGTSSERDGPNAGLRSPRFLVPCGARPRCAR